ncbi:thiamine diphosphokinase [Clostridium thermosuccinogenes]|nr:thiamine diphosphokinase [Pseudoclostridium thermosuccinogenes]
MSKAVIICNGSVEDYSYYKKHLEAAQFIICADGGATHALKFGIKPDVLLGDFDSIPKGDFDCLLEQGVEIVKYPSEKDMTDAEIAAELAMEKGYDEIVFIGATGTRLDHSLSNIMMLKSLLERGVKGIIVNEHNEVMVIDKHVTLIREENYKVTLLPLTEIVEGVSTKGLYYELKDATLKMGSSFGVSNEFSEDAAEVTIKKGLMLVIKARD